MRGSAVMIDTRSILVGRTHTEIGRVPVIASKSPGPSVVGACHADVVLVDSPPSLGLASLSILAAASHALVVTTPDALGGAGLRDSLALVESARKRLNRRLYLVGVLVCRADHRRNLTAESIEAMRKEYGAAMLAAVIPESAAAAEAPSHGEPLTTYDPSGRATEAYRAAAAEIIKRTKRKG